MCRLQIFFDHGEKYSLRVTKAVCTGRSAVKNLHLPSLNKYNCEKPMIIGDIEWEKQFVKFKYVFSCREWREYAVLGNRLTFTTLMVLHLTWDLCG